MYKCTYRYVHIDPQTPFAALPGMKFSKNHQFHNPRMAPVSLDESESNNDISDP